MKEKYIPRYLQTVIEKRLKHNPAVALFPTSTQHYAINE